MTARTELFDFPVERVPLVMEFGGDRIRTERDGIIRTDTNQIIGYVSAAQVEKATTKGGKILVDRNYYQVIRHAEIVKEAREAVAKLGLKAKESTSLLQNGGRMYHSFDFDTEAIEPAPGDFINMRLTLVNSYDLSRPIGFEVGGVRQVCTNGLMAFRKAFFEMHKHSGGFNLDETVEKMEKAVDTFKLHMLGFFKIMGNTPVSVAVGLALIKECMEKKVMPEKYINAVQDIWEHPDRVNEVIPATDASGKVIKDSFITVMSDPSMDKARTAWTLYNAFTVVLTHYVYSIERRMLMHQAVQSRISALINKRK